MKRSTSREEHQFFNIYETGWRSVADRDLLHGVDVRALSEDPDTGSATFMARFPAGWSATGTAGLGVELFVLEGDLTSAAGTVGAAGFVAIPPDSGTYELSSARGAYAFVLFNRAAPGADLYDGKISAEKIWKKEWTIAPLPGSVHGRMYKPLRYPDPVAGPLHGGPSGIVHMVLHPPGFHYPHLEHHHHSWEEMFVLTGDNVMPGRGEYGPGTYIANPAGFKHGMYMSQGGMLLVRHTSHPIDFDQVLCGWGPDLVEHYLDNKSLLADPRTSPWSDSMLREVVRTHPEYGGEDVPVPVSAS
jgi:hypothetical protein